MINLRVSQSCGRSGSHAQTCKGGSATHKRGHDMPARFWDTDYNDLVFYLGQAFFPRMAAWDNLEHELCGVYAANVGEHLAGTVSEPFAVREHRQIAVKLIDDPGNEQLMLKKLEEAEKME